MKTLEVRPAKTMLNVMLASLRSLPTNEPGEGGAALTRKWPVQEDITAQLVATAPGMPRCARLHVSFGKLRHPIGVWAARFWEADVPTGEEPVEWLLPSRWRLANARDALQLLSATHGLVSACEEC